MVEAGARGFKKWFKSETCVNNQRCTRNTVKTTVLMLTYETTDKLNNQLVQIGQC